MKKLNFSLRIRTTHNSKQNKRKNDIIYRYDLLDFQGSDFKCLPQKNLIFLSRYIIISIWNLSLTWDIYYSTYMKRGVNPIEKLGLNKLKLLENTAI